MQCDVTGCTFCISNKVEYLDKEHMQLQTFYQRRYIVISSNLCKIELIIGYCKIEVID